MEPINHLHPIVDQTSRQISSLQQHSSSLDTKRAETTLQPYLVCGERRVGLPTWATRAQEEPACQQRAAANDGELCAQHQARLMRDGPSRDKITQ